jgi:hypothetical protein
MADCAKCLWFRKIAMGRTLAGSGAGGSVKMRPKEFGCEKDRDRKLIAMYSYRR